MYQYFDMKCFQEPCMSSQLMVPMTKRICVTLQVFLFTDYRAVQTDFLQ